jgi:hypothetical protein
MKKQTASAEYYCVAVQRNYESIWRVITKHDTIEEAEQELERRRGFTGSFNYDNATLRLLSRSEAKREFGKTWEFQPIGSQAHPKPARRRKPAAKPAAQEAES